VTVYSSGPGQPDASGVELPTGTNGISVFRKSSGTGQSGVSDVERPAGAVGTSALVYSSGPGQPDASSVELPTGVGGASALVYSSGPGQPGASSVEQPTGWEAPRCSRARAGRGSLTPPAWSSPPGMRGTSAIVYSSGPGQSDAFGVEQPGPSSAMQHTGWKEPRHSGPRAGLDSQTLPASSSPPRREAPLRSRTRASRGSQICWRLPERGRCLCFLVCKGLWSPRTSASGRIS
jgi:hypothetical protein